MTDNTRINSLASNLPAFSIADSINQTLRESANLVVTAPPGAGKSTLLPLTILEGMNGKGKILMLEPRRLAARQIAERMASLIGEPAGKTVGYRVRFENKVSAETRIEVLTEGILTRMLVNDATLEGVDVIIFDEFHERSIHSDLALALTLQAQNIIRPDLKSSSCRPLSTHLPSVRPFMHRSSSVPENVSREDPLCRDRYRQVHYI